MLGLRRVLSNMALKICEAHEERQNAFRYMERAQDHARTVNDRFSAWACRGPYAGLSMVSGLLVDADPFIAAEHVQEFAELCWRSHGISAVLSPYADDLECQEFVGIFEQLDGTLTESHGR
jgi:hypothetical protein